MQKPFKIIIQNSCKYHDRCRIWPPVDISKECRRCNLVFEESFGALDTFDGSDAKLKSLLKNGFLNPVLPD